jgi:Gpi18-like mannosyltransferase
MNSQTPIKELAVIIIVTTVGTFFFSYLALMTFQNELPSSLLTIWNRWDTAHYLDIAQRGYSNMTTGERYLRIVFLPFYPLLIRLFTFVFRNYMFSALIVSNLAYASAAFYLYKLVLLDYSEETALRSVVYFSIFPTAYFLHAGYTESLFLALTIASFYNGRKERWWLSGLIGMAASLTRITGIILTPALVLEYLFQKGFRMKNLRKDILWLILIPFGFLLYLIINYLVFGDPFKFLQIQKEHWAKTLDFPRKGLLGAWGSIWWRSPADSVLVGWAEIIFGVFGFLLTIWVSIRLRVSYGVYMFITWLIITSTSYWLSIPRYTLSMFPLFIALSLFGRSRGVNYLITFFSLLFFGLFLSLFIQGRWAF